MRILFLTSHLELGGIPIYTVHLAQALAQRGHEPIVASSGGALVAELAAAGIPHLPLNLRTKSELHPMVALAVLRLAGLIRRHRPEILHAQTRVAHLVAGLAGRLTGVPVITTAHGFYRWHWGRYLFPFWGQRVIAVSPMTDRKLRIAYRLPPRKVTVIPNGIAWKPPDVARLNRESAWFRQVWGIRNGGPVIGTVARLVEAKGIGVLLEAFHRLRRQVPAAQLVVVGDGPQRSELVRLAYRLGEQDHVVFAGFMLQTATPLSVMDLYVQPSFREAFGLAVVEAMAMAKPVVASAVGGLRVVVRHGETGLLVPPRNPEALAAALAQLLRDPVRCQAMGEAGRCRFEAQFTIERMAEKVEQVYRGVLREASS